jgi:hypothetical protein
MERISMKSLFKVKNGAARNRRSTFKRPDLNLNKYRVAVFIE